MDRRKFLKVAALSALSLIKTTPEREGEYKSYLPLVVKNKEDVKIHSLQLGWWHENRIPEYEAALGLSGGGDQHLLEPVNDLQTVQVEEWYADYNKRWGLPPIEPHVLCYSNEEKRFKRETEAIAWVRAHPGMRYIIGNEPDGLYAGGGNQMTEDEFAEFYHQASVLIRNADPTAYLVMAGWAGGSGMEVPLIPNEDNMLKLYYERYGTMDVDALSWHAYQAYAYYYPYPVNKMNRFAEYVRKWNSKGWVNTTNMLLTEFSWYGLDENNTQENCIKYLDWFIPQLRAHPQVIGWYWWEWGDGAMLMRDGEPTEVGLHYAAMR